MFQCAQGVEFLLGNVFKWIRQERILRRARTEDLSSIERTGCIFLVRLLDEINGPYCVVYFHTATGAENRPSLRWMRAVYDNMEYRFKKNLKSLLIVHPTMWTKVSSLLGQNQM